MSTEMGISSQQNEPWAATNHLSGRGLVSHCHLQHGGVPEWAVH